MLTSLTAPGSVCKTCQDKGNCHLAAVAPAHGKNFAGMPQGRLYKHETSQDCLLCRLLEEQRCYELLTLPDSFNEALSSWFKRPILSAASQQYAQRLQSQKAVFGPLHHLKLGQHFLAATDFQHVADESRVSRAEWQAKIRLLLDTGLCKMPGGLCSCTMSSVHYA